VHDHDPFAVGRFQVEVSGAYSGAANDLQFVGRLKDLFGDSRSTAYYQCINFSNGFQELFCRQAGLVVKFYTFGLFENL